MSAARSRRAPAHVEVHYRPSAEMTPEEARRRVRLAYALLLGLAPWPREQAVVRTPDEADTDAGGAKGGPAL
jgi:hypothetical protein